MSSLKPPRLSKLIVVALGNSYIKDRGKGSTYLSRRAGEKVSAFENGTLCCLY